MLFLVTNNCLYGTLNVFIEWYLFKTGSHLGHIKLKASWAAYINRLALTWDHQIPHSYTNV